MTKRTWTKTGKTVNFRTKQNYTGHAVIYTSDDGFTAAGYTFCKDQFAIRQATASSYAAGSAGYIADAIKKRLTVGRLTLAQDQGLDIPAETADFFYGCVVWCPKK